MKTKSKSKFKKKFKAKLEIIFLLGLTLGMCGISRADQLEGRSYQVYLPKDYQQRRAQAQWPLIVLLHGFKASGSLQNSYLGLSQKVTSEQFILVVPDGTKDKDGHRFWNATPFCCDLYHTGVDDVGFLKGLIAKASADYAVDKKKVYLFGHSNGAFMAHRMACEIPEQLQGIITIAGMGFVKEEECRVKGKVSVMHIHGTADQTVSFEGREGLYPGAEATVQRWVSQDACQADLSEKRVADLAHDNGDHGSDGKETEIRTWNQCQEGKQVVFLKMAGVGHIPNFKKDFLDEVFSFIRQTSVP